MLYVSLVSILFFLRYAFARQSQQSNQIYLLVLIGLFVFSAFRYKIGCDWTGYYYQYVAATNFDWTTVTRIQEPIWWAILGWINASGFPYPVANVVSSAIFFIGIHILARRQPDPLSFLVLLFPILIINMPMSGIRQGAAVGLMCIAFTSFMDRRPLRFGIWVVLATGFHSSALIFMLLLPLAMGRYTLNRMLLAAAMALPGAYFLSTSSSAEFATSRYVGTGVEAFGAAFRASILALSALYFFLFVRKKWLFIFPRDYSLASIGSIGMVLVFLLLPISTVIADRFGYYFIPIQTMIFARFPFLPFGRNTAVISALPYLGLLFVFTVWSRFSLLFQSCYFPYQTWIFGFPGGDPFGF